MKNLGNYPTGDPNDVHKFLQANGIGYSNYEDPDVFINDDMRKSWDEQKKQSEAKEKSASSEKKEKTASSEKKEKSVRIDMNPKPLKNYLKTKMSAKEAIDQAYEDLEKIYPNFSGLSQDQQDIIWINYVNNSGLYKFI